MEACDELLGVVGAPFPAVREDRAVRGVGALIRDFFGVSGACLLRPPLKLDDDSVFEVVDIGGFGLRPAKTKGCRIAA